MIAVRLSVVCLYRETAGALGDEGGERPLLNSATAMVAANVIG